MKLDNKIHTLNNNYDEIVKKLNTNQESVLSRENEKNIVEIAREARKALNEANDGLKNLQLNNEQTENYRICALKCSILEEKVRYLLSVFNKSIKVEEKQKHPMHNHAVTYFEVPKKTTSLNEKIKEFIYKILPKSLKSHIEKIRGYYFTQYGKKSKAAYLKKQIVTLHNKKIELEAALVSKKPLNQEKKTKILKKLEKINIKIAKAEKFIKYYNALIVKAKKTREDYKAIGGEQIKIKTADNVTLDGFYFDAQEFRKKLRDDGGELMTLTKTFADSTRQFQAIAFKRKDFETNKKHILEHLYKLKAYPEFSDTDNETLTDISGGWCPVNDGDRILLIRDEYAFELQNQKNKEKQVIEFDPGKQEFRIKKDGYPIERKLEEIKVEGSGGLVISTSGILGVYEMSGQKQETLNYLMRGMSVVVFNFRGYGESEGIPTKEGYHHDMDAIYQFAKSKQPNDKKILFAALCMSGGPAAYEAGKHPHTNIFLNQSYSSLEDIAQDQIDRNFEGLVKEHLPKFSKTKFFKKNKNFLKALASILAPLFIPNFNVTKNIAKNHGHKGILYVYDDDLIPISQVEKNIKAVINNGKLEDLSVYPSPGKHGDIWLDMKTKYSKFLGVDKKIKAIEKEAEKKCNKLRDTDTANLPGFLKQANKLEKELNDIKKMKGKELQTALAAKKKEINDLSERGQQSHRQLEKDIKKIQESSKHEIEKLKKEYDPSIFEPYLHVRAQLDHFLSKAHLRDDILSYSRKV